MIKLTSKTKQRLFWNLQPLLQQQEKLTYRNVSTNFKIMLKGMPDFLFEEEHLKTIVCHSKDVDGWNPATRQKGIMVGRNDGGKLSYPRIIIGPKGFHFQYTPRRWQHAAPRVHDRKGQIRKPVAEFIETLIMGDL